VFTPAEVCAAIPVTIRIFFRSIAFSVFGAMMFHHSAVSRSDSFGIAISVGLLMGRLWQLAAFIEFVRRR
jgi:hypothetical protein